MAEAVLAIRLRTLGDVVLVTPALRALKRGHPDAELEVVTERRYAPLLERLEGIDRVWTLERSTASTLALAGVLVRRRYRVAVDFFGNGRSAFLTLASRARLTAGYDLRGRRLAYRRTVPRTVAPAPGRREYAAATHLRLAAAVGGVPDGVETRISIPPAAGRRAAELLVQCGLPAGRPAVGLVAAGSWPTKTRPCSRAGSRAPATRCSCCRGPARRRRANRWPGSRRRRCCRPATSGCWPRSSHGSPP